MHKASFEKTVLDLNHEAECTPSRPPYLKIPGSTGDRTQPDGTAVSEINKTTPAVAVVKTSHNNDKSQMNECIYVWSYQ